jgi:hypothetical protein
MPDAGLEIAALRAQLAGIRYLAEHHHPTSGLDAVFRRNVLTLAERGDQPPEPAALRMLRASLNEAGYDDISHQTPGQP